VLGQLITNISSAILDKIFIKIDVKYLCQIKKKYISVDHLLKNETEQVHKNEQM
jgi:hypothetical protein